MAKRKRGVASHFWAHKIHVKELIWLAHAIHMFAWLHVLPWEGQDITLSETRSPDNSVLQDSYSL